MAYQLLPAPIWQARRTIVAIGLLLASGWGLWLGVHERHQETISYADFARTMPPHGWFHITGAHVDLQHPVTTLSQRGDRSFLLAVYDANDISQRKPAALVLTTSVLPAPLGQDVNGVLLVNAFDRPDRWDTDKGRFGSRITSDPRVMLLDGKPDITLFAILFVVGLVLALILLLDFAGAISARRSRPARRSRTTPTG